MFNEENVFTETAGRKIFFTLAIALVVMSPIALFHVLDGATTATIEGGTIDGSEASIDTVNGMTQLRVSVPDRALDGADTVVLYHNSAVVDVVQIYPGATSFVFEYDESHSDLTVRVVGEDAVREELEIRVSP